MSTVSVIQSTSSVTWRVVSNFSMLSLIATSLVSMGKHSNDLLILVLFSVGLALVTNDWLGWIRIGRTSAHFGMLIGAAIALFGYWFARQSIQYYGIANLHAVANMLVYIQIPLMFQRRDPRLFEHWGVFLILEFVVAALLNDNFLYGVLLIPSLVVGCATMMSLAAYATHDLANKSQVASKWNWRSILSHFPWSGRLHSKSSGIEMTSLTELPDCPKSDGWFGWLWGLALGIGVALFSIVYFFGMPRLHTGAFEGLGFSKPLVGFSENVSLEDFHELMASNDLALRMTIREPTTNRRIDLLEPPYLRGTVVDNYDGRGNWEASRPPKVLTDVFLPGQIREELSRVENTLIVTIQEHAQLGSVQFSLPPFFHGKTSSGLKFNERTWCLRNASSDSRRLIVVCSERKIAISMKHRAMSSRINRPIC
ncbi:MAG: transglutaminaseTgpA domain-containing protein [Pirellulaceae bacterium]|nr:transglutaminaseTgpA domain-containing protein [Pirellulaceae bacterium]